MVGMRNRYVPPAIDQTAFNCPQCGALAQQSWYAVFANRNEAGQTPFFVGKNEIDTSVDQIKDPEKKERRRVWIARAASGRPFLSSASMRAQASVVNLSVSQCFNCKDIAIWIYDRIIWPTRGEVPAPNPDLPPEIRADYNEAGTILDLSPRGAAALLRLCVQKLCQHLGQAGDNINADIGTLVANGLPLKVQQALDVVRVVGNNAVHPGRMDLRDDRATAEKLFGLVNLIAEIMISQPKHVEEMYDSLPEGARKGIEKRDGGR